MELRAFVPQRPSSPALSLTGTELPEILSSLRHDVWEEFHFDTAERLA